MARAEDLVAADAIIREIDTQWEAFNASTLGETPLNEIPEVVPIRDAIATALASARSAGQAAGEAGEELETTATSIFANEHLRRTPAHEAPIGHWGGSVMATIAWAGAKDGGSPEAWSVHPTRREAIARISEGAISASDYDRLDRAGRWRLARKNGWRVVKVTIERARP